MPTLNTSNFNIAVALLGGFVSLFGLVSYLLKESYYLSEALISLLAGVAFSPHGANFIRPLEYARSDERSLEAITLTFTRLVLGVQLVLAGIQLPSRYLRTEWRSLALLLGPIMTAMWLTSSLLVWGLVPSLPFLHALAVGACVTPTDPVLSNVIVKGRFADHNIPKHLQRIIIAESGANDGLGYPFLFLALYLIQHLGGAGGAREAMGLWFGETWGYTILLSVVYGAAVGWLAKELLHYCEERHYVDRESFLVFAISLALFIVGTCGMVGSDDILACFIAGNVFTWDDWFRVETQDEYAPPPASSGTSSFSTAKDDPLTTTPSSLQPTIDMLLNVSIFLWYGAVCPWDQFLRNGGAVPLGRLVALGVLVLLLRRLPWVFALRSKIHQLSDSDSGGGGRNAALKQAVFTGFFGPIGCSAIFYLYITLEFIEDNLQVDNSGDVGQQTRPDVESLPRVVEVVVWFMVVCSVVVHGLCIPLGKLGVALPRTMSRTMTSARTSTSIDNSNGTSSAIPPFRLRPSANGATGILPFALPGDRDKEGSGSGNGASAVFAGAAADKGQQQQQQQQQQEGRSPAGSSSTTTPGCIYGGAGHDQSGEGEREKNQDEGMSDCRGCSDEKTGNGNGGTAETGDANFGAPPPRPLFPIGGSIIHEPRTPPPAAAAGTPGRTIRFPDDEEGGK